MTQTTETVEGSISPRYCAAPGTEREAPFVHEASLDIPQQSVSSRLDSPRLEVAAVQDSRVAQTIKHLSTTQETWVRSLGQEDPLEKGMVTHSSTLAWKIPWTEEAGGLQSMGWQKVGRD